MLTLRFLSATRNAVYINVTKYVVTRVENNGLLVEIDVNFKFTARERLLETLEVENERGVLEVLVADGIEIPTDFGIDSIFTENDKVQISAEDAATIMRQYCLLARAVRDRGIVERSEIDAAYSLSIARIAGTLGVDLNLQTLMPMP